VRVWSPIKKVMYDRERFISEYGVLPENFRLVKSLTGDSSDNIEGIKGFGPKTVAKSFPFLLERFSTVEDVLTAAASLRGVVGKRLVEGKSRFLENMTLMDLSEPMLSATAARQARTALSTDLGCREIDFRIRIVKDSVSFGGANFVGPFREFVLRRRRFLKEHGSDERDTDDGTT
jgi:5'-3' exonuclease